jgi:hypothetical protein
MGDEAYQYQSKPLPGPAFPFGLGKPTTSRTPGFVSSGEEGYTGQGGVGDEPLGTGEDDGGSGNLTGYWREVTDCDDVTFKVWTKGKAPA